MFAGIYLSNTLFSSKLVYRLKVCNFVSKEIVKKPQIKLSEILKGPIL